MPKIASPETYFSKLFQGAYPRTPLVPCALQALVMHLLATFKFWLTTSKSVENTAIVIIIFESRVGTVVRELMPLQCGLG